MSKSKVRSYGCLFATDVLSFAFLSSLLSKCQCMKRNEKNVLVDYFELPRFIVLLNVFS